LGVVALIIHPIFVRRLFKEARNKTLRVKRRHLSPVKIVQLPFLTSQFSLLLNCLQTRATNACYVIKTFTVINMAALQGSITLRFLFTFCEFLAQRNISVKLSKYRFRGRTFCYRPYQICLFLVRSRWQLDATLN